MRWHELEVERLERALACLQRPVVAAFPGREPDPRSVLLSSQVMKHRIRLALLASQRDAVTA